jgi:hypothetical protein
MSERSRETEQDNEPSSIRSVDSALTSQKPAKRNVGATGHMPTIHGNYFSANMA